MNKLIATRPSSELPCAYPVITCEVIEGPISLEVITDKDGDNERYLIDPKYLVVCQSEAAEMESDHPFYKNFGFKFLEKLDNTYFFKSIDRLTDTEKQELVTTVIQYDGTLSSRLQRYIASWTNCF